MSPIGYTSCSLGECLGQFCEGKSPEVCLGKIFRGERVSRGKYPEGGYSLRGNSGDLFVFRRFHWGNVGE